MLPSFFAKHQKQIETVAKRNAVSYLALFGSYSRGDQDKNSDIDLLVEFAKPVGLIHLIKTEHDLEDTLEKKVDLVTKKGLSKHLKQYFEKDLKVLYETN
jgi:hypothetical protein